MKEEIFQEKVAEIIQDNDNLEEIETAKEEFKDFVSKPVFLTRPISKIRKFVFSFDNLGLEQEFCEKKKKRLFDLVKKVKYHSERKELVALLDDVTQYLKYQKEFSAEFVQSIERNQESEFEEKLAMLDDEKENLKNSHFIEMYEEEFEQWDKQSKKNSKNNPSRTY